MKSVIVGLLVVGVPIGLISNACSGDDDNPTSGQGSVDNAAIRTCPDYLEVAGPYRQGIDPAYDESMDWDGDGVSCE
jgi:Excalibur calcium-binding domain